MEMSKQSWADITQMPVKVFYDYLKWKTDLEKEKEKMITEEVFK